MKMVYHIIRYNDVRRSFDMFAVDMFANRKCGNTLRCSVVIFAQLFVPNVKYRRIV